jgi:hypothetical protein
VHSPESFVKEYAPVPEPPEATNVEDCPNGTEAEELKETPA